MLEKYEKESDSFCFTTGRRRGKSEKAPSALEGLSGEPMGKNPCPHLALSSCLWRDCTEWKSVLSRHHPSFKGRERLVLQDIGTGRCSVAYALQLSDAGRGRVLQNKGPSEEFRHRSSVAEEQRLGII